MYWPPSQLNPNSLCGAPTNYLHLRHHQESRGWGGLLSGGGENCLGPCGRYYLTRPPASHLLLVVTSCWQGGWTQCLNSDPSEKRNDGMLGFWPGILSLLPSRPLHCEASYPIRKAHMGRSWGWPPSSSQQETEVAQQAVRTKPCEWAWRQPFPSSLGRTAALDWSLWVTLRHPAELCTDSWPTGATR